MVVVGAISDSHLSGVIWNLALVVGFARFGESSKVVRHTIVIVGVYGICTYC